MNKTISLSKETLTTLKNFGSIGKSLLFPSGNTLSTINSGNSLLSTVRIDETIPNTFAIYNLNDLVATLSLFKDPKITIEDQYMIIRDEDNNDTEVKYLFCNPKVIKTPPKSSITLPSEDVLFTLDIDTLNRIKKASSVMGLQYLYVNGSEGKISLELGKYNSVNGNLFRIVVGDTSHEFSFKYVMENINLIPDDYKVVISSQFISQFTSLNSNRKYWISTESGSKFKKEGETNE